MLIKRFVYEIVINSYSHLLALRLKAEYPEIVAELEKIYEEYMEECKENIRPREYINKSKK